MKKYIFMALGLLAFMAGAWANPIVKVPSDPNPEPFYAFPGWNRKQPITIQANQVSGTGNLTDFPVLITLDHLNSEIVDSGVNSALNGGGDIRFSSDAAGNNQLAIEVVEFVTSITPGNRRCQIWVKVPSLSATSNTTLYIWYNKSGEVQPSPSSTFGSQAVWSNYHFVSHDGLFDSASQQFLNVNGSPTVGTTPYGGKSWKGNGTTDYSYISSLGLDLSGNLSISLWKKNTAPTTNYGTALTVRNSTGWFLLRSYGTNAARTWFASEPPTENNGEGARAYPSGDHVGWHYFSVSETTLSGENELMRANGLATTEPPTNGYSWNRPSVNDYITIGNTSPNNTNQLDGELAEIRISETVISPDFSDTEYNNQRNPSLFALAGTPESVSGGMDTEAPNAPVLSSTGHTSSTADLSWSGATDNVGVTGYKIYKDGNLEATLGNVPTHQVTGLTASTAYSFTIRALDAAANESPLSNAVSVTTDAGSGGGTGDPVWTESGSVASYTGDVAIGTSSVPSGYKLAVEGKIRTREIRVDQDNWPDYVFKSDYNLPSLEDIKKHIDENGHLPNIPSAKEVEANGVELGEINRLLLEKIEELTLYILHQGDQLNNQEKINQDLLERLEKLEVFNKNQKQNLPK